MTREEAHELVDKLYDSQVGGVLSPPIDESAEYSQPEAPARVLPEGKRVVRTKASGDRVYLLDEVKKTRQWVTNPEVLDSLGFTLNDVGEVDEDEMLKYQMSAALYRRVDETN